MDSRHAGYFSFGTPDTVLDAGGNKNPQVQRNQGDATTLTFVGGAVGGAGVANKVRFGFSQSADHEDFSIQDLEIITCVTITTTITATTTTTTATTATRTTTTNTMLGQLHRELEALKDSAAGGADVAVELSDLVGVVGKLETARHFWDLLCARFAQMYPCCCGFVACLPACMRC
jgi:hypothetical protein